MFLQKIQYQRQAAAREAESEYEDRKVSVLAHKPKKNDRTKEECRFFSKNGSAGWIQLATLAQRDIIRNNALLTMQLGIMQCIYKQDARCGPTGCLEKDLNLLTPFFVRTKKPKYEPELIANQIEIVTASTNEHA